MQTSWIASWKSSPVSWLVSSWNASCHPSGTSWEATWNDSGSLLERRLEILAGVPAGVLLERILQRLWKLLGSTWNDSGSLLERLDVDVRGVIVVWGLPVVNEHARWRWRVLRW